VERNKGLEGRVKQLEEELRRYQPDGSGGVRDNKGSNGNSGSNNNGGVGIK